MVVKYYVYMSREKQILNVDIFVDNLLEKKRKEKQISLARNNKTETYNKK